VTERSHESSGAAAGRLPLGIALWLVYCATMSCAGWVLSALHQLNAFGYAVVAVVLAAGIILWEAARGYYDLKVARVRWHRRLRRLRKPLPLAFLILAALAFISGFGYEPSNYDALAYRVPRVLHWLAAGQWHWVHTEFPRLNVRACGAEWLMAPLIAWTKGTRLVFLSNAISYVLLPGLLFSVFTRMGVRRKAAWQWMWIIAAGQCYVMQAGGIGNDLPGAVYALAALDFGLRLRVSRRLPDLWMFLLASALLTSAKASNVPLLLPACILILPHWRLFLARPLLTAAVLVFATMASFVPTAVLNWKYCHDWTGMRLEGPMQSPAVQLAVNTGNWLVYNFFPPVFPLADRWSRFLTNTIGLSDQNMHCLSVSPLQLGEGEALGMFVCLLVLAGCLATWVLRRRDASRRRTAPATLYWILVLWSPFVALLAFGIKAQAVASSSRLLTPYYALLLAPLLVFFFDEAVFRRRWWKWAVAVVMLQAIAFEILIPGRPLWPALTVLERLKASHPSSGIIGRAETIYSVYARRAEGFAPLVAALPADAQVVGMVTFDDPETSLWWPYGSRRIEHVTLDDTPEKLSARGIRYIIAPQNCYALSLPVEDVIRKYRAVVRAKVPLQLRAASDPRDWYILEIGGTGAHEWRGKSGPFKFAVRG